MDLYAALDDPDFDGNMKPKNPPVKKNINMNKKVNNNFNKNINVKKNEPIKKNFNNNYNKNIKQNIPIKKNINTNKKINNNNNNKNIIYENPYSQIDNDKYDEFNDNLYHHQYDPLSIFSPLKKEDDVEEEKNIIPGHEDIKSKIDMKKIESIITSLNDQNYTYKSIEEFQSTLKDIAMKNNLTNEESQAYLVYCWIAKNIKYYIGSMPDNSPKGALQKRVTHCSGYSRLFKEVLKIFKIKSVLVHGIGRTYNLTLKPHKENHEWNAIKLNGKYYLCEVTWGAGKVENNKFIKNYSTFYFCCPPELFINTHFPSKDLSQWMLLDKKISQEQFENLLYKDKFFFNYNFIEIQPNEGIVKLKNKNDIEIKFINSNNIKQLRLSCKVYYEQKLLENISYIEKFDNYFIINLIFNKKGIYNVLYFATDKTGTVNSDLIARQQFSVMSDAKVMKQFPTLFTFPDELHIIEPKYNNLPKNKEINFQFISNDIDEMGIVIDKKCTHLEKIDGSFMGKFFVSGEEILVGKFEKDNPGNLKVMMKYKVKNK